MTVKMKKPTKWSCLIGVEVLIVLVFVIRLFLPLSSLQISGEECSALSHNISDLSNGAYQVRITYDAVNGEEAPENRSDYMGTLRISSNVSGSGVLFQDVKLTEDSHVKESRLWLRAGYVFEDLLVEVFCDTPGELTIHEIAFKEIWSWRLMQLLGVLLFITLADGFLYYFTEESFFGLKGKDKYVFGILVCIIGFSGVLCFTDFLFWGHDAYFHIDRIVSLADGLSNGQFPNRIYQGIKYGYGYAAPLFYGELFLYLPAVLYLLGTPLQLCYQIYVIAINIATVLIAYWCAKKMTGSRRVALVFGCLYSCSLYRLVSIYLRAAVGEYTAMTFLPLIVCGFYCIYCREQNGTNSKIKLKDYAPIIIGLTGLIQSHMLSCWIIAQFIGFFVLLRWRQTFQKERFLALCKCVLITLALNAWFLVPFLQANQMDVMLSEQANTLNAHRLYPAQIFGFVSHGSGISVPGMAGDMPLSLGITLTVGVLLLAVMILRRKEWKIEGDNTYRSAVWCLCLGLLACCLTSVYFPWDMFGSWFTAFTLIFGMVQFPWRYLGVAAVFICLAIAFGLKVLENVKGARIVNGVMLGLAACTVVTGGVFFSRLSDTGEIKQIYFKAPEECDCDELYLLNGTDISQFAIRKVDAQNCNVSQFYFEKGSYYIECASDNPGESYVEIPVCNYDNYHAYDSLGNECSTVTGGNNNIRVLLPQGYSGMITVRYEVPVVWRLCEWISFLTLACLVVCLIRESKGQKKS